MRRAIMIVALAAILILSGCSGRVAGYAETDDFTRVEVALPQDLATGYFWSPTFVNGTVEVESMVETDERVRGYGASWTANIYKLRATRPGEEEVYFVFYPGERDFDADFTPEYYYAMKISTDEAMTMTVTHTAIMLPPDDLQP